MSEALPYRPKTGEIPTNPGVYRFRDVRKRVLYVGKAKNLRARLSNYFQPLERLHERTRRMVTTANSVEWTVVGSELEALQLEFTWIKEFDPPFNVVFKDDKSYPYLLVTDEEVPRAVVIRNRKKKGRYFGPYTKVWAIRETLDLMLKAFPIRSCEDGTFKRASQSGRPCLLADIGKCTAPCVGCISPEDYRALTQNFISFLSGNDARYIRELTARMMAASEAQDYEQAARLRDDAQALETVMQKTAVVLSDRVDCDVFGLADDELAAAVHQFIVRGGRIRGTRSWVVDKELDVSQAELVELLLTTAYDGFMPPREILVPALPDDAEALEEWLTSLREMGEEGGRGGAVTLRVPQRGDKAQLAETAEINAKGALMLYKTRRTADFTARSEALGQLRDALGMADAPLRIECYDVSHLQGTNVVASMVVFEDGLAKKSDYRRFSIAQTTDDTDSIYQVLSRRLNYLKDVESTHDGLDGVGRQFGSDDPILATDTGNPNSGLRTETQVQAEGDVGHEYVGQEAKAELAADMRAEAEGVTLDDAETKRRQKFAYPPQLLLIDGGVPQVTAAKRALDDAGLPANVRDGIVIAGIAKRLEELWLPNEDFPVILPRNSEALFLVQRARDEAHRFAITFQRQRRRRDIGTVLGEVPGLGPNRVKELLRSFSSVARLRQASPGEIAEVRGIGSSLAEAIHAHLHAGDSGDGGATQPADSHSGEKGHNNHNARSGQGGTKDPVDLLNGDKQSAEAAPAP